MTQSASRSKSQKNPKMEEKPKKWPKPRKKPKNLPSNRPREKRPSKNKGRAPRRKAFEEVRLGHLMKYRAPLEYALIMESATAGAPNADLIESISYASINPFFRTILFRRALIDYRINGLYGAKGKHRSDKANTRVEQKTYLRILKENVP